MVGSALAVWHGNDVSPITLSFSSLLTIVAGPWGRNNEWKMLRVLMVVGEGEKERHVGEGCLCRTSYSTIHTTALYFSFVHKFSLFLKNENEKLCKTNIYIQKTSRLGVFRFESLHTCSKARRLIVFGYLQCIIT
jgi:hypothetical protein